MRINCILLLFILFQKPNSIFCQADDGQRFENIVHGVTTIIKITRINNKNTFSSISQGTGFFYHEYKDSNKIQFNYPINPIDSNLKSIWLITNKHVLFGDNFRSTKLNYPNYLEFYLRKIDTMSGRPVWDTLEIQKNDLMDLTKLHSDSTVDVVAINVTKLVMAELSDRHHKYYYAAISRLNFPSSTINKIEGAFGINVGTDILSIGYPKEFYDYYNLFPTVKAGIIASKWELKYDGRPYFLIDSKLFPGSSGSIIISKQLTFSGSKDFDFYLFLGIYSGELIRYKEAVEFEEMTITKKESFNTGIVWYYYLIDEIIGKDLNTKK